MMTRDKHYQPLLALTALLLAQNAAGVTLGFLEEDYAVTEGGTFTATVTKDDMANDAPIELSILPMTFAEFEASGRVLPSEIQDITSTLAPAQSGDFSSLPISVTIPPSPAFISQAVPVSITVDDLINEAMEDYLIVIEVDSIVPANETVNFVREGVALVRVRDNDLITIEFTQGSYTVDEVNGTVNDVALRKMDGVQSEQDITVLLNYVSLTGPGSATAGVDYVDPGQFSVPFLPSVTMVTIPIVILEDTDTEGEEAFTLQITLPPNPPSGVMIGPSSFVFIADDDIITHEVGFLRSTYTVLEGETAMITYGILTDPTLLNSNEFAVLEFPVFPDSATAVDYTVNVNLLTVLVEGGNPIGTLEIPTVMDSISEGTETFTLRVDLNSNQGEFMIPQSNSQATVFIVEPATFLELTPTSTLIGIEGDTAILQCGPIGGNPIDLLVNGVANTSFDFVDSTGNRTYSIGPLNRAMNGTTFQCMSGSLSSEITTLLVYYGPIYTVSSLFERNEGEMLRVDLNIEGFPLPPDTFSWTFNGQPLTQSGSVTLGADFIEFSSLQRGDQGLYTVTAMTLAGSGNASFELEVFYPPEYMFEPVYTIVEGESQMIQLTLDGRPLPGLPNITWFFNGQILSSSSRVQLTSDVISWNNVVRGDAGTYTVIASNRAGSGNATFDVVVIYPPTYTVDDRIAVIEGGPVRINLTLDANPDPSSFNWMFNGAPYSPPPDGGVGVSFIDFGASISRSASGTYFVESSNAAGSGNATFQLVVYYPPVFTVNSTFEVMEGQPFVVNLLVDALPALTDSNVTWFFNDQPLMMIMGIDFGADFLNIQMTTRLDNGTYRVEGTNIAGTGSASFQLLIIVPSTTLAPMTTTMRPMISTSSPVPMITTSIPISVSASIPDSISITPTLTSIPSIGSTSIPFLSSSPVPTPTPIADPQTTQPPDASMRGDPHFSVLLPTGQQLCFSIQGQHGYTFNLISNKLLQMNARFVPDSQREEVTWIGSLGIVITSKKMNKTKIRFEAAEKMIYIGEKLSLHVNKIDKLTFSQGKLSVSEALRDKREKHHFHIDVDLSDIGLMFGVDFVKSHLDMTWKKVGKQPPASHGIIGQFFCPNVEIDEPRRLLLLPGDMEPVPVMRKPVWAFMERETTDEQLCWVAMNPGYQGKKLLQGHYLDYLVDDVLSSSFKFKLHKHKKAIDKLF